MGSLREYIKSISTPQIIHPSGIFTNIFALWVLTYEYSKAVFQRQVGDSILSNWFRFEAISTLVLSFLGSRLVNSYVLFAGIAYSAVTAHLGYHNASILGSLSVICFWGIRGGLLPYASLGIIFMAVLHNSYGFAVAILGGILGGILHTWWGKILTGLSFLSGIACMYLFPQITTGRLRVWRMIYDYMLVSPNRWLGEGLGSFLSKTVELQEQYGITQGEIYLHAHNDYLELLFEIGILGMFPVLVYLGYLLFKSKGVTRSMLMAFMAASFINWPLYSPVGALLFFYIVRRIHEEDI